MRHYTYKPLILFANATLLTVALVACSSSDKKFEQCYPTTVDISVCDPASATFSLNSTNKYYPLIVGNSTVLEGTEDGVLIRVERKVLDETQVVGSVTTRVLEAKEFIDGALYEVARNFYVEASDGTVCYFGEDVTFYENGQVANTKGSWRADATGAKPGVIMPAKPAVGQAYFQEQAPDVAMDMGRIVKIDGSLTANAMTYANVVSVMDTNPLDDCADEEEKLYVPGVGEAGDTVKKLISFVAGAQ